MLTGQSRTAPAAAAPAAPAAPAFKLNLSSSATAAEAAKQIEAKQIEACTEAEAEAEAEGGGGTRDLARDLVAGAMPPLQPATMATMSDYGGSTVIHPQVWLG